MDFLLLDATDFLLLDGSGDLLLLDGGAAPAGQGPGAGGGRRRGHTLEQDDDEVMQIIRQAMEILEP